MDPLLVLKLYILGFWMSFIIQGPFQGWFAKNSFWKRNIGWQNEIAIWNIGMIIILYGIIRNSMDHIFEVRLGLFVMSFFLCINHLTALFKDKSSISNIMGAVANFIGLLIIFTTFL